MRNKSNERDTNIMVLLKLSKRVEVCFHEVLLTCNTFLLLLPKPTLSFTVNYLTCLYGPY